MTTEFSNIPVRLRIASTPMHLPVVRAALESFCELMGLSEPERSAVILAVDEALTNVIRHAYHGEADQPIDVSFARVGSQPGPFALEIQLRDWGVQVPPEQIKSRDLGDVRPGGLGVHIMRQCMDEVKYCPAPEGGTCLKMIKKLPGRVAK